jgi:hypothetical protein
MRIFRLCFLKKSFEPIVGDELMVLCQYFDAGDKYFSDVGCRSWEAQLGCFRSDTERTGVHSNAYAALVPNHFGRERFEEPMLLVG